MNLKSEKGSITVFVLVLLLFMSAFLIIAYASNVNISKTTKEQFDILSDIYSKEGSNEERYDRIYAALRNKKSNIIKLVAEDTSTLELNNTFEGSLINYKLHGRTSNTVLPEEYKQLTYIEGTGTQYMDIGIGGSGTNGSIYVTLDFQVTEFVQNTWICGMRNFQCGCYNNAFYAGYNYSQTADILARTTAYASGTTNSSLKFMLFARDYNGTVEEYRPAKVKIFSTQIYIKNSLERDLIPCYRVSDGVAGMYDLVYDVFYTNSGTGEFKKGAVVGEVVEEEPEDTPEESDKIEITQNLPEAYQQVEYIESTGTQYIDTLIKVNQNSKVEAEIELNNTSACNIFGSRTSATENNFEAINDGGSIILDFENYNNNRLKGVRSTNKNVYIISNTELVLGTQNKEVTVYNDFETPETIYIFDVSGGKLNISKASAKLYYFKVWNNDLLVRDFKPCYRKSDNVVGLYDLVEGKFYTNAGTGEFSKGADVKVLPSEYQEVEYIESTGTQYIDTGVVPSNTIGTYVDFAPLSNGTIFGSITSLSVGYYGINVVGNKFEVYWGKSLGKYSSWEIGTRYKLRFNYLNSNKFVVDEQEIASLSSTVNLTTNNIHLFKLNEGTTQYTQYISAKLYEAKMTDGETLIRDFVPCYRKSDNVAGLYDLVEGKFYTNSGTGEFTKGNVVGSTSGGSTGDSSGDSSEDTTTVQYGIGDLITNTTDENYGKYKIPIKVSNKDGESVIKDIILKSPLYEGDYIEYGLGKVVRKTGIIENINLPRISIYEDYAKIEILTAIVPSKIEVEYKAHTLE